MLLPLAWQAAQLSAKSVSADGSVGVSVGVSAVEWEEATAEDGIGMGDAARQSAVNPDIGSDRKHQKMKAQTVVCSHHRQLFIVCIYFYFQSRSCQATLF